MFPHWGGSLLVPYCMYKHLNEGEYTHAVFWFIVSEKLLSTKNRSVETEIKENALDVILLSLGLCVTL